MEPKGHLEELDSKFEEVLGFSSPIEFCLHILLLFMCEGFIIKTMLK